MVAPSPAPAATARKSSLVLKGSPHKGEDAEPKRAKPSNSHEMDVSSNSNEDLARNISTLPTVTMQINEATQELTRVLKISDANKDAQISDLQKQLRDSHVEKEQIKKEMQDMRSNERTLYEKLADHRAEAAGHKATAEAVERMLTSQQTQMTNWVRRTLSNASLHISFDIADCQGSIF